MKALLAIVLLSLASACAPKPAMAPQARSCGGDDNGSCEIPPPKPRKNQ